jgi:hypothetical protein
MNEATEALDLIKTLSPEQKKQFVESLGLEQDVLKWKAQDDLKLAKKNLEKAASILTIETAKYEQLAQAETGRHTTAMEGMQTAMEAAQERFNERLASLRTGLDSAESGHMQAIGDLNAAESSINDSYAR